ncbi:MAG: hypothetical protein KatS3mg131_1924 [Candidatus Tectimicrobiota bacterium]|nr:MAG: hypothetical protein KatS3mg131_1924 [Candidatus Tectomicrobia bacterium]
MAETERKLLKGHPGRFENTFGGGAIALAIGIVAVVAGVALMLFKVHIVAFSGGGCFAMAGLALLSACHKDYKRHKFKEKQLRRYPGEPWRGDYPWNEAGVESGQLHLLGWLLGLAFFVFFLLPFNWVIFKDPPPSKYLFIAWSLFTGLFDLLIPAYLYVMVLHILKYRKYGRSRLAFRKFPFFLGDEVHVAFSKTRGGRLERVEFTLRCLEQYYVRRAADHESATKVVYQRYKDTQVVTPEDRLASEVEVRFPLPDDPDLSTRLTEYPNICWELEVRARVPGVDFHDSYLLPVYRKA